MAPTRLRKPSSRPPHELNRRSYQINGSQEPTSDVDSDDPMEKDETEERLEKLIFGDDAGFLSALKQHDDGQSRLVLRESSAASQPVDGEVQGLEDVPDADLFFLDSGPTALPSGPVIPQNASDNEEEIEQGLRPAWEDSDDERIVVSLASHPRLRKLRFTEAEDVVSGKEYIKRLRIQYERLYPRPAWASSSCPRPAKRRKRSGSQTSASDSDRSDMSLASDIEEGEKTVQPLAKLLQTAGELTHDSTSTPSTTRKLRPEVIDIQRSKDIPGTHPSSVDSLSFHPTYPLLLSSGPASTIYLHHISTTVPTNPNPLLTSLHLKHTPLHMTAFLPPTGNRILLSGRRRYFHAWDLSTGRVSKIHALLGGQPVKDSQKTMERFKPSPCGRFIGLVGSSRKGGGVVNILDAKTYQWTAQVRIDSRGGVADFAWWADGEGMAVAGKNGEVSEWDGRERRIVARWIDEGAVGTTGISLGGKSGRKDLGGDRWVAIGSSSGVVNIYDRRVWLSPLNNSTRNPSKDGEPDQHQHQPVPRNPKPLRALDQLTTPTSHLHFSPGDGQLLVMASRWKRDALRLVHLPSCTVYRNWPTSNTPFGRISSVAWSPRGEMLAVGNEQGKVRLWEVRG